VATEPLATPVTPLLYSVHGAARVLGLGRSKVYELIRTGTLRTVKIGRRRLVPAEALSAYVARLVSEQAS
jgi:excisionase family DNA binding protein